MYMCSKLLGSQNLLVAPKNCQVYCMYVYTSNKHAFNILPKNKQGYVVPKKNVQWQTKKFPFRLHAVPFRFCSIAVPFPFTFSVVFRC